MQKLKLIVPVMLVAGLALAQQAAPSAEELILKLGSEEYAVREDATKRLVEMGEKAIPALEKALQSNDVEVRMRAGRALRAIRDPKGGQEGVDVEGDSPVPDSARPGVRNRSYSIEMRDGRVKVRVKELVEGKEETREYEGESIEQLKKDHPELADVLGGFRVHVGPGAGAGRPDFDIEKFWSEWNKDFDEDFWKNFQRDQERTEKWFRRLQEQRQRMMEELRQRFDTTAQGALLGARVTRPEEVLDAQLELRGKGLVIDSVDPGSLADRLGMQRFDILIELGGREIAGAADVGAVLRGRKDGDPIGAKVIRRGRPTELKSPS